MAYAISSQKIASMILITGCAMIASFIVSCSLATTFCYGLMTPLLAGMASSLAVGGITFSLYVVEWNADKSI